MEFRFIQNIKILTDTEHKPREITENYLNMTIIDSFKNPIGTIDLQISADITQNKSVTDIKTLGYQIKILRFTSIKEWVKDLFPIEDSVGWILYFEKINDEPEDLKIICELSTSDESIEFSPDSGEGLDAVWIENATHFLSIGTEDNERLRDRANIEDCMPKRFDEFLKNKSFTQYLDLGFETLIPNLYKGEVFYIHYLVAVNPRQKNKQYPNEDDISTNLAVDYSKSMIIKNLNLSFNK